ncbi:MAG TPA: PqiC family protein [Geobacteraceae bacterium]
MKRKSIPLLVAVSALLLAALLCACGSTAPSRFYTLGSMDGIDSSGKAPVMPGGMTVGVGPLDIPDYLERPQIVTRSGDNGLEVAQYDRWAGSLKQDIMRVLIRDLSAYLPSGAMVLSWKRGIPVNYRVAVEVTGLDVIPGSSVLLRGQWAIFGSEPKNPLVLRSRSFTEPLTGNDMNTTVAGMGKAVGQLGQAIAADIAAQTGHGSSPTPAKKDKQSR